MQSSISEHDHESLGKHIKVLARVEQEKEQPKQLLCVRSSFLQALSTETRTQK